MPLESLALGGHKRNRSKLELEYKACFLVIDVTFQLNEPKS
jgi:hypothetical protein